MEGVIKEKTSKDKVIEYITYIFIYAFLGWIMETIYAFIIHGHFIKRGFLFGPICPIYGFGAVLLIIATKKLYNKPFLKFVFAIISFTVFEYFVSLVLEMLFGLRWWDYSNDFLNIQGRVSLLYSIFWGIIGIIVLEKIHPFIQNKIQNITNGNTNKIQYVICFSLLSVLMIDIVFSTIRYL